MRCYNCSIEVNEDTVVCPKCGKIVQEEYECTCGEFLDVDEIICPVCGEERRNTY